jgi:hypothetical protein
MVILRTGCTLEDCKLSGGLDKTNGVICRQMHNDISFVRTIIEDCGGNAVWGAGDWTAPQEHVTGYQIIDCIGRRNNRSGENTSMNNGCWKFLVTDGMYVDGMICYDNFGPGLWMDAYHKNFTVKNGTFFGTRCEEYGGGSCGAENPNCNPKAGGIVSEVNMGPATITHNTCYKNLTVGIAVWEGQDHTVEYNTLFGNYFWDFHIRCMTSRQQIKNLSFQHNATTDDNNYAGPIKTECAPWEKPGSNLVYANNTTITSLKGADYINPSFSSDPAPQLTSAIEENTTIDDAISGKAAGDEVSIPVFGRKAIEEDGGQWVTEVYDLNGRYVRVAIGEEDAKNELESGIQQYAVGKPDYLTVTLSKAETYAVEASIAGGSTVITDGAVANRSLPFSVRTSGSLVTISCRENAPYRIQVVRADGRIVGRFEGTGRNSHVFRRDSFAAGLYFINCSMKGRTWTGRLIEAY